KPPPGMAPADFPDGGLTAWSVCLGAFCCLFASFGWITCIGVFQTYYQTHQLKSYSSSDVAWIPSVEIFMMQVFAPVFGKVFDGYGPRGLLIFGTFFHIFGLMMTSLGKEYYQLFLAQAVCSGMGASALFYAGTNSLLTWFFKRRALATGIAASGASLGGVIMPIMINRLIPRIGFGWTMRALAFMLFGLLLIANVTVKSRLPHKPKPWKVMDFVVPLKEPKFLFLALGSFFFFWGLFLPINFIVLYAQHYGMSESLSNYQLPILNAGSVFGRIIPGYLGDRFGRFNVTIATTVFSTIIILALWIPGTSNAAIIVFSILYGFASGAFVAMVAALVAQVSDIRQIGVRNGTNFFVISWAALTGNPIAGALISHNNGGYIGLQIFGGVVIFVGALFFIASRHVQVGPGLK
ncbi:major facilitator superfamily domain-containing protein, partial [Usnea florida]